MLCLFCDRVFGLRDRHRASAARACRGSAITPLSTLLLWKSWSLRLLKPDPISSRIRRRLEYGAKIQCGTATVPARKQARCRYGEKKELIIPFTYTYLVHRDARSAGYGLPDC